MAKFELKIYDMKTEEVEKTYSRNKIPVNLFLAYQELSEKLVSEKIEKDIDMFKALKGLFMETFDGLTDNEYDEQVDVAEVLITFRNIIKKATVFEASKN